MKIEKKTTFTLEVSELELILIRDSLRQELEYMEEDKGFHGMYPEMSKACKEMVEEMLKIKY